MSILVARTVDTRGRHALEIGARAPGFRTRDANGRVVSLRALQGKVVILACVSVDCPAYADWKDRIAHLSREYENDSRVRLITTRDVAIAHKYGAAISPSFYVIDQSGRVAYSGAFDNSRNAKNVTRRYVEEAVAKLLSGEPVAISSTQAFGCSMK